ncbi:MAG: hypothetical protein QW177_01205 [Candidatus Nitrosotenuis sp.]
MDKNHMRISVVIEKALVDKLRTIQAEMIHKSKENVSFSFVVNEVLKEGLESR